MNFKAALICALFVSVVSAQSTTPVIPNIPSFNFTNPGLPTNLPGSNSTGSGSGLTSYNFAFDLADISLYNFLLQVEFLEGAFWQHASSLTETFKDNLNETTNLTSVSQNVQTISNELQAQTTTLNNTVNQLCSQNSGDWKDECFAVAPCQFNFNSTGTAERDLLTAAATIHGLAVQAFLGVVSEVTYNSTQLIDMATVQARHHTYLRYATGQNPFIGAQDSSATRTSVRCQLRQYIANPACCQGWQHLSC